MKNYKNLSRTAIVIAFALAVQACASNATITKEQADALERVAVSPEVGGPNLVSFRGRAAGFTAQLGLIGTAVGTAVDASDQDRLNNHLQSEKIDVKALVHSEFEKRLSSSKLFRNKVVKGDGAAVFKLSITGLHILPTNWSFSGYRPILGVMAVLEDQQGNVIWERRGVVTHTNSEVPAYTFAEYFEADNLRETMAAAVRVAVSDLVSDFGPEETATVAASEGSPQ